MLHSFVSFTEETSSFVVCAGAERKGDQLTLNEDSESFYLKQLFEKQDFSSVIVGWNANRSVFVSHFSTCIGSLCNCRSLVVNFLSENYKQDLDSYLFKNHQYLLENVQDPFLGFFVENNRCIAVSSYGKDDLVCMEVTTGDYEIRNCIIAKLNRPWVEGRELLSDSSSLADVVSIGEKSVERTLKAEKYFPTSSSIRTIFITLTRTDKHSHLALHEQWPDVKPDAGPKCPVNAFNFFSMAVRQTINAEKRSHEMSNNDWHRYAGKMWKKMSHAEQEPYREQARNDKKRYEKECAESSHKKRVRHTTYNLFVHQEKQFVLNSSTGDVQKLVGKHCSARWKQMDSAEKELYELLSKTDQGAGDLAELEVTERRY